MGQKLLVAGHTSSMRLWEEVEVEDKEFIADYEVLGYLISGEAILKIGGEEVALTAGDSWKVPKGAAHSYTIKQPLKAIEVCSPGNNK